MENSNTVDPSSIPFQLEADKEGNDIGHAPTSGVLTEDTDPVSNAPAPQDPSSSTPAPLPSSEPEDDIEWAGFKPRGKITKTATTGTGE